MIRLEVIFQPGYGDHLYETPLSKNQAIEVIGDGQLHVTATVANTPQLQWWLMGFGGGAEVTQPKILRDEMAAVAEEMALTYRNGTKR